MLIKLYASEFAFASASAPAPAPAASTSAEINTAVVRKPIGPDHDLVKHWVAARFGPGWASEAQVALSNRPVTLWIAVRHGTLFGFACFDATARGFVGPIGVDAAARGRGVGAALLRACLHDMRSFGYGYAVAGGVSAPGFFERVAGAVEIAGSSPGLYAERLAAAALVP